MDVALLPAQKRLLQSKAKKTGMFGGIGTGKTRTLAYQAIDWVVHYPKARYMITANTHTQLLNATIPGVIGVLEELSIPYEIKKSTSDRMLIINGTKFLLYSLTNYEHIRGIEVGGILSDEIAFAKRDAYDVMMGRLRDKKGPLMFRGFSSPNGFNWCYDEWGNIQPGQDRELVQAKTSDNIFLPEGYFEDLVEQYGGVENPLARQELFGEFVNLTAGQIYWGFDRDRHVKPTPPLKGAMTYIGQDFNVDPMSSVCVQHKDGIFRVYRENILYDSNSYETAQFLVSNFAGRNFCVIPDSTGRARKSSAVRGATDLQIFRDHGIHILPSHNPLIRDRQNNVNVKFQKGQIQIDPSCKTLIKELETLSSRDKEGLISHAAVALGYVIHKLDPIKTRIQRQSYSVQL